MLNKIHIEKLTIEDYNNILSSVPKEKHHYLSFYLKDRYVYKECIKEDTEEFFHLHITYRICYDKALYLKPVNRDGYSIKKNTNKIKFIGNKYEILYRLFEISNYTSDTIRLTKFNISNELKKFSKHKSKELFIENFNKNDSLFNKEGLKKIIDCSYKDGSISIISRLPKKKIIEISNLPLVDIPKVLDSITSSINNYKRDYFHRISTFLEYLRKTKIINNVEQVIDVINNSNIDLITSDLELYMTLFHDENIQYEKESIEPIELF